MILIAPDIIKALKSHTFSLDRKVNVSEAYSVTSPTYPMLTLDELPSNDGAYIDGMPCVVRNVLILEAYAQNSYIQKELKSRREAVLALMIEADTFLNENFGLTMIGPVQAAPYSDSAIYRAVANYYVYIDTRTNTICRSIK